MNTIRSTIYGWGALIVAGGGAYYFAKKNINAERAEKAAADRRRKEMQMRLEHNEMAARPSIAASTDSASNPSQEASADPAPTRHAPETQGQQVWEKSKYEASDPFRSKKGDRFS